MRNKNGQFIKGHKIGMAGKKHTKKTRQKISLAHKGKKHFSNQGFQKGHGFLGNEETRKKISKNNARYWKDRPFSKEHKKRNSEAHKGEKSNFWKGGISFEPYGLEFNKELKEVIRNRDRRKCKICNKTELEDGEKLSCHHIDYNKQNNNPNNLISLCRKCHRKTNNNRDRWINYFNKLICC